MPREPLPICGDHPKGFHLTLAGRACDICGRMTNSIYVMCGWCAEERGVCVLDGNTIERVE
jgi:hypothetical protein